MVKFDSKKDYLDFLVEELSFRVHKLKVKKEFPILKQILKSEQEFKPFVNLLILDYEISLG